MIVELLAAGVASGWVIRIAWRAVHALDRYERRLGDAPDPAGLVGIRAEDPWIIVTPRGVEIDLTGSDLELADVLEHVETIEAL